MKGEKDQCLQNGGNDEPEANGDGEKAKGEADQRSQDGGNDEPEAKGDGEKEKGKREAD